MSNLVKYIQTINESDTFNALEKEKLFFLCFKSFEEYSQITSQEEIDIKENEENTETNKEDVENDKSIILKDLQYLQQIVNDHPNKKRKLTAIENFLKDKQDFGVNFEKISKTKKRDKTILHRAKTILRKIESNLNKTDKKNIINENDIKNKFKEIIKDPNKYSDSDIYKKIYKICIKFFKENKIDEKKITNVEHIGAKQFPISNYWQKLSSHSMSQSVGKTDIVFNNRKCRLSLKSNEENYQIASPTYYDIYNLFIHAINEYLLNNANIIKNKIDNYNKKSEKKIIKEISDLKLSGIQLDNSDKEHYLQKFLGIKKIETEEYATVITAAMLFDLIIKYNIHNIPTSKISSVNINDIDKACKELKNKIDEFKENSDLDMKGIFNTTFNITDTDDEIKNLIDIFKKNQDIGKYLNKFKDNHIEKLKTLLKDDKRFEQYAKYAEFRKMENLSNDKIQKLFNDKESNSPETKKIKKEFLNKILEIDDNKELQKILENEIEENIEKIKIEILKEAIAGKSKFTDKKAQPSYLFEFNTKSEDSSKFYPIRSPKELENYIKAHVLNKVVFDFSFKGKKNDEKTGSIISLRIKKIINSSFYYDLSDDSYFYNEGFFSNMGSILRKKIDNFYDSFNKNLVKILYFSKNKAIKLLNFLGIKVKIKKARMPQWIINKL